MKGKTAVLLVNLGTPDSPKTLDVGSYLFQFLNDKRVIDISWLLRKILVNLLIVPFEPLNLPKYIKICGPKKAHQLYTTPMIYVKS